MTENLKQIRNCEWKRFYLQTIPTNYMVSEYGDVYNTETNYLLTPYRNDRYWVTHVSILRGTFKFKTHVMVATLFVPNDDPVNKTQVNHIDGNKDNNHCSNLEWVTPKENMVHALKTGLLRTNADENTIHLICKLLVEGEYKPSEIAKMTGMSKQTITDIKNKRTWKHITEQYDFLPPRKTDNLRKYSKEVYKMLEEGFSDAQIIGLYEQDIGKDKVQYLLRYNKKKLGIDYDPKGKERGVKKDQRLSNSPRYIIYQKDQVE